VSRQLAICILKRDFNLEIDLRHDRLCPTVSDTHLSLIYCHKEGKLKLNDIGTKPVRLIELIQFIFSSVLQCVVESLTLKYRLNYILWLKDLFNDQGPPFSSGSAISLENRAKLGLDMYKSTSPV